MVLTLDDVVGPSISARTKAFLQVLLPLVDKNDATCKQNRQAAWNAARGASDSSANNKLTLPAAKRWLQRQLRSTHGPRRGIALFQQFAAIYPVAYEAACSAGRRRQQQHDENDDEKHSLHSAQFRLFLAHLCFCAMAWDAFQNDDDSPKSLRQYGFAAVASTDDNEFDVGSMPWKPWCATLQEREISSGTTLGWLIYIGDGAIPPPSPKRQCVEVTTTTTTTTTTLSPLVASSPKTNQEEQGDDENDDDDQSAGNGTMTTEETNENEGELPVEASKGGGVHQKEEEEDSSSDDSCSDNADKEIVATTEDAASQKTRPGQVMPVVVVQNEIHPHAASSQPTAGEESLGPPEGPRSNEQQQQQQQQQQNGNVAQTGCNKKESSVVDDESGSKQAPCISSVVETPVPREANFLLTTDFMDEPTHDSPSHVALDQKESSPAVNKETNPAASSTVLDKTPLDEGQKDAAQMWMGGKQVHQEETKNPIADAHDEPAVAVCAMQDSQRLVAMSEAETPPVCVEDPKSSAKASFPVLLATTTATTQPAARLEDMDSTQPLADEGASPETHAFLDVLVPLAFPNTEEAQALPKRSPFTTLPEACQWIQDYLVKFLGQRGGLELYQRHLPAYQVAWDAVPADKKKSLRLFLAHVCVDALAWDAFDIMLAHKTNPGGTDRLSVQDFASRCERVAQHGFFATSFLSSPGAADAVLAFLHPDEKETVGFSDWSKFLKESEVTARTVMGLLLSIGSGNDYDRVTRPEAEVLSWGLSEKIAGEGASDDARIVLNVFLQLLTDTVALEREWGRANVEGTGALTLDRLGKWIEDYLLSALGEKGVELYDQFFPVYTRAFHAAKQEHTTLSVERFRSFLAFLCVFALAFDAFLVLRQQKNERGFRLSKKAWIQGYSRVANHGFVALSLPATSTKGTLKQIFKEMNGDRGRTIRLTEWYEYMVNAELSAGTAMGRMISMGSFEGIDGESQSEGAPRDRSPSDAREGNGSSSSSMVASDTPELSNVNQDDRSTVPSFDDTRSPSTRHNGTTTDAPAVGERGVVAAPETSRVEQHKLCGDRAETRTDDLAQPTQGDEHTKPESSDLEEQPANEEMNSDANYDSTNGTEPEDSFAPEADCVVESTAEQHVSVSIFVETGPHEGRSAELLAGNCQDMPCPHENTSPDKVLLLDPGTNSAHDVAPRETIACGPAQSLCVPGGTSPDHGTTVSTSAQNSPKVLSLAHSELTGAETCGEEASYEENNDKCTTSQENDPSQLGNGNTDEAAALKRNEASTETLESILRESSPSERQLDTRKSTEKTSGDNRNPEPVLAAGDSATQSVSVSNDESEKPVGKDSYSLHASEEPVESTNKVKVSVSSERRAYESVRKDNPLAPGSEEESELWKIKERTSPSTDSKATDETKLDFHSVDAESTANHSGSISGPASNDEEAARSATQSTSAFEEKSEENMTAGNCKDTPKSQNSVGSQREEEASSRTKLQVGERQDSPPLNAENATTQSVLVSTEERTEDSLSGDLGIAPGLKVPMRFEAEEHDSSRANFEDREEFQSVSSAEGPEASSVPALDKNGVDQHLQEGIRTLSCSKEPVGSKDGNKDISSQTDASPIDADEQKILSHAAVEGSTTQSKSVSGEEERLERLISEPSADVSASEKTIRSGDEEGEAGPFRDSRVQESHEQEVVSGPAADDEATHSESFSNEATEGNLISEDTVGVPSSENTMLAGVREGETSADADMQVTEGYEDDQSELPVSATEEKGAHSTSGSNGKEELPYLASAAAVDAPASEESSRSTENEQEENSCSDSEVVKEGEQNLVSVSSAGDPEIQPASVCAMNSFRVDGLKLESKKLESQSGGSASASDSADPISEDVRTAFPVPDAEHTRIQSIAASNEEVAKGPVLEGNTGLSVAAEYPNSVHDKREDVSCSDEQVASPVCCSSIPLEVQPAGQDAPATDGPFVANADGMVCSSESESTKKEVLATNASTDKDSKTRRTTSLSPRKTKTQPMRSPDMPSTFSQFIFPTQSIAGTGASSDIKAFLSVFLPLAYTTEESTTARGIEWVKADTHEVKALSLGTVERWIQRLLCSKLGTLRGMKLYNMYWSAFSRAFNACRDVPTALSDDSVNRSEFRLLISYLCMSVLALDAFMAVEACSGIAKGRLSCEDFLAGCHAVASHGFIAFADTIGTNATKESLVALFNRIDKKRSGTIQLKEWIKFLEDTEVAASTYMGLFISIDSGVVLEGDGRTFEGQTNHRDKGGSSSISHGEERQHGV